MYRDVFCLGRSRILRFRIRKLDRHSNRKAAGRSWITTRPLEQINDTKELNQVQLAFLTSAKVVDNSVGRAGVIDELGPVRGLS